MNTELCVNTIRPYCSADLKETVRMWRASYEGALGIRSLHSIQDQEYFLENILAKHQLWVAENDSLAIVGFMALSENWLDQLYLAENVQGQGLGSEFMAIAKRDRTSLTLYTFEKNTQARQFYAKHGFAELKVGGLDNEEKMADVLMEWRRTPLG